MHSGMVSNCSTSLFERISVITHSYLHSFLFALALTNPEGHHLIRARSIFQRVTGLAQQVGNVESGQWVGAFDNQDVARRHAGQSFSRAQGRDRTFQPAQVECLFHHPGRSISAALEWIGPQALRQVALTARQSLARTRPWSRIPRRSNASSS